MPRSVTTLVSIALTLFASACETVEVVVLPVVEVEVLPTELTLVRGQSQTLDAVARGANGVVLSGRSASWSSNPSGVAAVDGSGRVTAVAVGQATVTATVDGVQGSTTVTVLPGPAIVLSATEVELTAVEGRSSATRNVAITNGGNGVLSGLSLTVDYAPGEPDGWLSAGLGGTQAPTSLSLQASAQGLPVGTYQARVTVRSPVAFGTPPSVLVRLTVRAAPPRIVLDSDAVSLSAVEDGQQSAVQTVGVSNGGGGALTGLSRTVVYQGGQPTGWLTATLADDAAPTTLSLQASPDDLSPGVYQATVFVISLAAENSPQSLAVTFTVVAASATGASDR